MNRLARLMAVATLAFAATFAPSASFAHTDVVSTNPEPDSTIQASVVDIDIEFAEDLMASPDSSGSEVQITDSNGSSIYTDCVYVDGSHLRARAALFNDGLTTITWRTVGDDGHPLSDSYTFTVENPDGKVLIDNVGFCDNGIAYANNVPESTDGETAVAKDALADAAPQDNNGGLVGLAFGVLFIIGFAVLGGVQAKRRQDKEASKNR